MDASTRGNCPATEFSPFGKISARGGAAAPPFILVYFLIVYAHYYVGKRIFVNDVLDIVVAAERDLSGHALNITRDIHIHRFARKIEDITDGEIGYDIVLHGVIDVQHLGLILAHYRQHLREQRLEILLLALHTLEVALGGIFARSDVALGHVGVERDLLAEAHR